MNVACPHCRGEVEHRGDIALKVITCPHCRRQFQMPAFEELIVPQAQPLAVPQFQQPAIFVNTSPRPRKRLKASGWFANSAAVAVVVVTSTLAIVFASCGGIYYWMKAEVTGGMKRAGENLVGTEKEQSEVRRHARATLRAYGIESIADNATAIRNGRLARLSGVGLDSRGKAHSISVTYDVNKFGNTVRWEVVSAVVDGDEMTGDNSEPLVIAPLAD